MAEPVYYSIAEFETAYGLDRTEVNRYIALGVIQPRRVGGNSILTETDMMRIVRYNTTQRIKNNH